MTFNHNVFGSPLLVEGGEASVLSNADNMLSEIKVLGVKAEEAEPQVAHSLCVLPKRWPTTGLQVVKESCVNKTQCAVNVY